MSMVAGALVLLGAVLVFAGSLGLLTFRSFYERVHPPTMGATLGAGCILLACVVHFSMTQDRLVVHHLLIGVFMLITTPVTFMLLVRAALHRDAVEGRDLLASRRRPVPGPMAEADEETR